MTLSLAEVPPHRLPDFRSELDAILARCPRGYTLDWILERIDAHALHPLAIVEDDLAAGLVLVSVDASGPRRALYLVGIAGALGGRRGSRALLGRLAGPLGDLARHLGCAVIQGVSSRRGWLRHARPVGTIYEMEVG